MSHTPHMKQLLDELYQIEPGLRDQEKQLEKVVAHMTNLKPDISAPDNFKKILKNQLDSMIRASASSGVHTKNRYFRMFWYIFGAGALASFALSFGFLGIFPTSHKEDIKPVAISDTIAPKITEKVTEPAPIDTGAPSLAMTRALPKENPPENDTKSTQSISTKTVMPAKKPEEITPALSDSLMAAKKPTEAPVAMSLMRVDTESTRVSVANNTGVIAYVGEELALDTPVNLGRAYESSDSYAKGGAIAADSSSMESSPQMSNSGVESSTGTIHSGTGMTFAMIVSRAQSEAMKLIPEGDRPFYELSTPRVTYISQNKTGSADTVELVQVYIFPLIRTDGKELVAKEIQVVVP